MALYISVDEAVRERGISFWSEKPTLQGSRYHGVGFIKVVTAYRFEKKYGFRPERGSCEMFAGCYQKGDEI